MTKPDTVTPYAVVPMPVGEILVAGTDAGVCVLIIADHAGHPSSLDALRAYCPEWPLVPDAGALAGVTAQLAAYLAGERRAFDVPLALHGTPFQQRVWEILLTIRYGETLTYGDIAHLLGKPGGAQAVGGAVGRNPVSIIVPCHCDLGSDGSLTGYMWGTHVKWWHLAREGIAVGGRRSAVSDQQFAFDL